MLDYACLHNESNASQQAHPTCGKSRQGKSVGDIESLVRKKIKRQVQSLVDLSLVVCGLGTKTENLCAKRTNRGVLIAKVQDSGVQPRAPGISPHPGGSAIPGRPVSG
jgi:hypothetical protein